MTLVEDSLAVASWTCTFEDSGPESYRIDGLATASTQSGLQVEDLHDPGFP